MKQNNSNIFKFLVAASIILVNVLTSTFATFAWFSSSTQVENTASNLVATHDSYIQSYEVFPYYTLPGGNANGTYTFSTTATTTTNLGKFSLINSGYQIMVKVELTDYAASFTSLNLYSHTSASFFLGELDSTTNQVKQLLAASGNSLSSIVCFYAFTSDKITTVSGATPYYSVNVIDTCNVGGKAKNFVSDNKLVTTDPVIANYNSSRYIYFVIDYDKELINSIYGANIGNPVISDASNIDVDGNSYISYDSDFYFYVKKVDA